MANQWYYCIASSGSGYSASGYGRMTMIMHTESDIIKIASESAWDAGTSLEEQVGIKCFYDEESDSMKLSREFEEGEEFQAAVDWLRHDGHIFEVYREDEIEDFRCAARIWFSDEEIEAFLN
ncbi:MAG TPA: hypothetical protein V6C99_10120 [Oculatellaceae cyanobacterium]